MMYLIQAPEPLDNWNGTWDATKEGPACYSHHWITGKILGAENCLFLNVYTPNVNYNYLFQ